MTEFAPHDFVLKTSPGPNESRFLLQAAIGHSKAGILNLLDSGFSRSPP